MSLAEKLREQFWEMEKKFAEKHKEESKEEEEKKKQELLQIIMEIANVKAVLRETRVYKLPWGTYYNSVIQLIDGDYVSHVFNVDYKTPEEMRRKVKLEILRYLSMKRILPKEVMYKVW